MQDDTGSFPLRRSRLLLWFVLGVVAGIVALVIELSPPGSHLSGILRVGAESPARTVIEMELGQVPVTNGVGHDGQYSYLVARDPFATEGYANLADDGGYRFRRALYGWLAGGFGQFTPRETLWGLLIWAIVGLGLATAAIADVAASLNARRWAIAGVVANIGLWLSIQLATPDALGMGLSLVALALVLRKRTTSAGWLFAAAALTKETFMLFPLALTCWLITQHRFRRAIATSAPPLVVLVAWSGWLSIQLGDGFSTKGNLALPLTGLLDSLPWSNDTSGVLAGLAILGVILAISGFVLDRSALLRWLTAPWIATAIISSSLVWKDGNNAARALAPCWMLGVLALAHWRAQSKQPAAGPVRDSTSPP